MIKGFKDRKTEKLFEGTLRKGLPSTIIERAIIKLDQLDSAQTLDDLRLPPSNHLEALSFDRKGQHSIRINRQWRICFVFQNGHAYQVEIVDYH
ncbi:MAG: type II toxin-antitoxin system RelE/ParE family toxin [Verrucomicrobiota bacterium]